MPVGDEEVALVLRVVLEADPVVQGAHVVAEVGFAGGAHALRTRLRAGVGLDTESFAVRWLWILYGGWGRVQRSGRISRSSGSFFHKRSAV